MNPKDRLVLTIAAIAVIGVGGLAWSFLKPAPAPEDPTTDPSSEVQETAEQEDNATTPQNSNPTNDQGSRVVIPEDTTPLENPEVRPAPDGPAGTLRGYVFAPGRLPVAGAEIQLLKGNTVIADLPGANEDTGVFASTNGEGMFLIENLATASDYVVKASHPDWSPHSVGPLEVKENEITEVPNLILKSAMRVHGLVTNASGLPISGALVSATDRTVQFGKKLEPRAPWKTVVTDASGVYEFSHLSFKNFSIAVAADGYATLSKPNHMILSTEKVVQMDFELGPAFSISGWVKTEDGGFVEGAKVVAHLLNTGFGCEGNTQTDASGAFTLGELAEGQYVLNVEKDGFSTVSGERVDVGTSDKIVVLKPQGSISGVVVAAGDGRPVKDFVVTVKKHREGRNPLNTNVKSSVRNQTGKFTLGGLDPDIYKVYIAAKGFAVSSSDPVQVQRGERVEGLQVIVGKGGTIEGRVVTPDGSPVAGAIVRLNTNNYKHNPIMDVFQNMVKDVTRPPRGSRTKADGTYRLALLSDGEYQVSITHPKFSNAEINDVVVADGQTTQAADIVVSAGGSVVGVVYNSDGHPLPGATVAASTKEGFMKTTVANEAGAFELKNLRPGNYKVMIQDWPDENANPMSALTKMAIASRTAQDVSVEDGRKARVDVRVPDPNNPADRARMTPRSNDN